MKQAKRYAKVAGAAARVGAGVAASRLRGGTLNDKQGREAALMRVALGGLKGPLMKVGQLLAAIPDFLPPDYAAELATLQANAPSMGWPFVRRRMAAELGANWQDQFKRFERTAAAAASLGQVHRAVAPDGTDLACKLQYPDMDSIVEADLRQLKTILGLFERFDGAVSTQEAFAEIADRLREELDYEREARSMALYAHMLADHKDAHVPQAFPALSTRRLLSMSWLEGDTLATVAQKRGLQDRNEIAKAMFRVWYAPFYGFGVIHGDPHPGNYTVRPDNSINLMDFGCIRLFAPQLIGAVLMLYEALRDNRPDQAAEAYRLWGFQNLSKEMIEALNIWARFVYAPLLEDRVIPIEETNTTAQGREAVTRMYHELKKHGSVSIPREFVLIDRASIGLGGVFLRLRAEVNWHRLFEEMVQDFDVARLTKRQQDALERAGLTG